MDDKDHQENEVTMDDLEEEFKSISPSDLGGVTEGKGSEAKGSKESVGLTAKTRRKTSPIFWQIIFKKHKMTNQMS